MFVASHTACGRYTITESDRFEVMVPIGDDRTNGLPGIMTFDYVHRNKKTPYPEAIIKIRTFCNYRERCHKEVRDKLYSLGLWKKEVDQAIVQMMDENLLNEERFARSYARGHFTNKRWGKYKIRVELRKRLINDRIIDLALTEIDDDAYQKAITHLTNKKLGTIGQDNKAEIKARVANYLLQKGYAYVEFKTTLEQLIALHV